MLMTNVHLSRSCRKRNNTIWPSMKVELQVLSMIKVNVKLLKVSYYRRKIKIKNIYKSKKTLYTHL
jgi:hypothetical protein